MNKFESVVETIGKDVVAAVKDVVGVGEDVFRVLTDANKLAPAFKTELAQLITDGEPIVAALAPIVASEGTNITLDLAAVAPVLADIRKLVADFVAFLPTLKQAVSDLEADVR
jgi:hypothetical protein